MTVLDNFVDKWTTPPYSYITLAIIITVCFYIFYVKVLKNKDSIEHFKSESIEYIIKNLNLEETIRVLGDKLKKGYLYYNMKKISVNKLAVFNTAIEKIDISQKGKKEYDKEKKFLLFSSGGMFSDIPLLNKLSSKEYFLIEDKEEFIKKDEFKNNWTLQSKIHLHLFGGVWICSLTGTSYLSELIYKRMYENEKEVEVNTPKRFVWYNDQYASKMTSTTLEADLENESFNRKVARETSKRK